MDNEASENVCDQTTEKKGGVAVLLRVVVFLLLATGLFVYLNLVVDYKGTPQTRGSVEAFYDLEEDIVDVMYIGTSATSRLYINPVGYHDYGIASYSFGINSSPIFFYDDLIREVLKTQNPKLFVIELREATKEKPVQLALTLDSISPFSTERPFMVWDAFMNDGKSRSRMSYTDYLFPIARYHERLVQGLVEPEEFLLQGVQKNTTQGFRLSRVTVTQSPQKCGKFSDKVGKLSESRTKQLNELLDFCDTLDADVLFVMSPFSVDSKRMGQLNAIAKLVQDRGYSVLNCNNSQICEDMGITWETDFYNRNHTNYLGAQKYTDYFSRYLKSNYDLPDRRGDASYEAWDRGYDIYRKYVKDGIRFFTDEEQADD